MTAFAPGGMHAPVKIRIALFLFNLTAASTRPAAAWPTTFNVVPDLISAALIAYPSIAL
jgi:hypothetical protein